MTISELFQLPIGTWLRWSDPANVLVFIHYRDENEVILRRRDDSGYFDQPIYPDTAPWVVEALSVVEFSGFPPERDGLYIYREFRDLKTARATIESEVYVIDHALRCVGHEHNFHPVLNLTIGPQAIGEWAFIHNNLDDWEPPEGWYADNPKLNGPSPSIEILAYANGQRSALEAISTFSSSDLSSEAQP